MAGYFAEGMEENYELVLSPVTAIDLVTQFAPFSDGTTDFGLTAFTTRYGKVRLVRDELMPVGVAVLTQDGEFLAVANTGRVDGGH